MILFTFLILLFLLLLFFPFFRHNAPYQTFDDPSSPLLSWTTQQVCQWLKGLNMEQYVPEFSARDVDGQELLQMDGNKLKVRGLRILSSLETPIREKG